MEGLLALKASLTEEEVDDIYAELLKGNDDLESDDDFASMCKL